MAASAVVGALRIDLLMDAGHFVTNIKGASRHLSGLQDSVKRLGKIFATISGIVSGVSALFVTKVVNMAKSIHDLSQQLGMSTESISTWKYALDQTGLTIDDFRGSVNQLSMKLTEIADGNKTNSVARALNTLGISAFDAAGQLKSAETIIGEVSDQFAKYADSSNKTAIAVALFGESGAKLIPILNQGSEGMARMRGEAESLGQVLSAETAAAANQLHINTTRLYNAFWGIFTVVAEKLLPWFVKYTDQMLEVMEKTDFVKISGENLTAALKYLITQVILVTAAVQAFAQSLLLTYQAARTLFTYISSGFSSEAIKEEIAGMTATINAMIESSRQAGESIRTLWEEAPKQAQEGGEAYNLATIPVLQGANSINEAIREQNRLMAEGKSLMESLRTPYEEYAAILQRVAELQQAGAITAQTAMKAQQRAGFQLANTYLDVASDIGSALTDVFKENKAAAIAAAIINTAQAITRTLAVYGMTPLGIAAAAAAAASGAAQIAAIRSANKSGGGSVSKGASGASSTSSGSGSVSHSEKPERAESKVSRALTIQSVDPNAFYSGQAVQGLIEAINDAVQNGTTLISTETRQRATA